MEIKPGIEPNVEEFKKKNIIIQVNQNNIDRVHLVEEFDEVAQKMGFSQRTPAIFIAMKEYIKTHKE